MASHKDVLTYTKARGRVVAQAAIRNTTGTYHVIASSGGKWAVVPAGRVKAIRLFTTKYAAIRFAKNRAAKYRGEVVIHAKTGLISEVLQ